MIQLKRKLKLIIVYGERIDIAMYQDIPIFNFNDILTVYKKANFGFRNVKPQEVLCYI